MPSDVFVIVTAYNEADRIAPTLAALAEAFPGAPVFLADDGSTDATASIAGAAGARVIRSERVIGKGGAATLAAREALERLAQKGRGGQGSEGEGEEGEGSEGEGSEGEWGGAAEAVVVLCDGDLGESAGLLRPLVDSVFSGEADLAVAAFSRRIGGGLGLALGFAGWAIHRRCGLRLRAPISGQRALSASTLAEVLPFARGFGMEMGMTIDAARSGRRVVEIELDLSHRATGRTFAGFRHRGRQLLDFVRAYLARR